jgi:ubiquinone/menaquinone biosynthesis C-methylase UbiE
MQEITKKSYNIVAKEFSASRNRLWPELAIFKKYVKNNDIVLDLGCGNGRILELFDNINIKYLGVDNNAELINCAKEKYPDKKFVHADILEFDIKEKFDVILMVAVLNHFNKEQRKRIIDKIYHWLLPGGYLLMTNWNMLNLKNKKSVWYSKMENGAVITEWKTAEGKIGRLPYYILTKLKIRKEFKDFEILHNKYYTNGQKSNFLFGNNLLTCVRKKEAERLIYEPEKVKELGEEALISP